MIVREDKSILYQFKPQMASAERFEKIGEGPGYIWGFGSGYLEYTVPPREDRRQVSEIIVRAHIQPVLPIDAPPGFVKTRVTLFVEGWNGGSRLIPVEPKGATNHSGVAFDGKASASARDAWIAADDSFRRHTRIRLALRRQHLKLARGLRFERREAGRGGAAPLDFRQKHKMHNKFHRMCWCQLRYQTFTTWIDI